MIFSEALRLYPPAWIITRKALDDDAIGGYRIPANSLVVTSPYATHRLDARSGPSRIVSNPNGSWRLRPQPGPASPIIRSAAAPGCASAIISRRSRPAMVIAMVAQRFTLRLVPGHTVEVEPGVTLRPKHGLMMTLSRR